jgi:hypothetical protein
MIDLRLLPQEANLLSRSMVAHAVEASVDSGVGIARQFLELVLLRLGPGKLTADDYYKMRVYLRDLSLTEKKQYLSINGAPGRLKAPSWSPIAHDKLVTYTNEH